LVFKMDVALIISLDQRETYIITLSYSCLSKISNEVRNITFVFRNGERQVELSSNKYGR